MRIIIGDWGIEAYASYGLLVALVALLPFADLGMAAVVINAVADNPDGGRTLRLNLLSVFRVLISAALALVAVALTVTLAGGWRILLGESLFPGESGEWAVFVCLAIFGVNLPASVGARVLIGLGRNSTLVLVQTIQYPLILVGLLALRSTAPESGTWLPTLAYAATLVVNLWCYAIAAHKLGHDIGWGLWHVASRSWRGASIGHTAIPMLVQSIAIPLATQSDRIVISQVGSTESLAQYNLGSQVFMMVWQVTGAAGVSLWPIFARMKTAGRRPPVARFSLIFGFAALLAALILWALTPLVEHYIAFDEIQIPPMLSIAFVFYVALNAFMYPFGMLLTDPRGLRFQAICVSVALPVNIALSIWLTSQIGAAGPVVGSATCLLAFQLVPYIIYVARSGAL